MIRGGANHRFDGYGNVQIADHGHYRGWQLKCSVCGALSSIIHHHGKSYPPKMLYKIFRQDGWKLGGDPKADVCPKCQNKIREQQREERKLYINGAADRLIEAIRLVDKLMANSVTTEYAPHQPEIAAQLRSLFETAYLTNMISPDDLPEEIKPPPKTEETPAPELQQLRVAHQELLAWNGVLQAEVERLKAERDMQMFRGFHEPTTLMDMWKQATEEQRAEFMLRLRYKNGNPVFARNEAGQVRTLSAEPPEPPPPPPAPKPQQEPQSIHPRTAAYLAEMRKKFLGEGASK